MNSASEHYYEMKKNLQHAKKLVSNVSGEECKTQLQKLKLRGYILITHSIIEQYLESLGEAAAIKAKTSFTSDGYIVKSAISLISTCVVSRINDNSKKQITNEINSNLSLFLTTSVNNYLTLVRGNHGIKTQNQINLLAPLGIDIESFNYLSLSQNLNTYGSKRGAIAHTYNRIQTEETLDDIQSRLDNIQIDLEELDIEIMNNATLLNIPT